MRLHSCLLLVSLTALPAFSQSASSAATGLPKNPRDIFTAAAPFYDFNNAAMKPWHLKATYQLYDQHGSPGEKGTFEYWWASPKVQRSSWTRASATRTEWSTEDGRQLVAAHGDELQLFEQELPSDLFSPLPDDDELKHSRSHLEREDRPSKGGSKIPCVSVVIEPIGRDMLEMPRIFNDFFCFDNDLPMLRYSHTHSEINTQYSKIEKFQNRALAHEVSIQSAELKLFAAVVDEVRESDPMDPALKPDSDALPREQAPGEIDKSALKGLLIDKVRPSYPDASKRAHEQGIVIIHIKVGISGAVSEARLDFSPYDRLGSAALDAVKHWKYKPYRVDGHPKAFVTTVSVAFFLN